MSRSHRLFAVTAFVVAVLLALSVYLQSWGGVALVMVGAAGFVWYRVQVTRGEEATERFFGDAGEDTRLTSLQVHNISPSEMTPLDRTVPPGSVVPPPSSPPR